MISEEEELVGELAQSRKRMKKTNDGDGSNISTSTGGLTNQFGLSEVNEMIGQELSTIRASFPVFGEKSLGIELPPREELVRSAIVCQRSNYYPSQPAKALLKDCFELNSTTVLDLEHTTTNLNADQMIQFACPVGLEVTLASYSLFEGLLVRSPVVSGFGLRGPCGRSLFAGAVGSTGGDTVASQTQFSLPTLTSLITTSVSGGCSRYTSNVSE